MILQVDSGHGVSVCHRSIGELTTPPLGSNWLMVSSVSFFCHHFLGNSLHLALTSRSDLLVGHPCGISSFKFAEIQGGGTPWKKGLRMCWEEGSRKSEADVSVHVHICVILLFPLTSGSFSSSHNLILIEVSFTSSICHGTGHRLRSPRHQWHN